jgi:Ca2+-transporting ATPase
LNPNGQKSSANTHQRKGSNATFTSSEEGTEVDHDAKSSATDVASRTTEKGEKGKKKSKKSKKGEEPTAEETHKVELAQDDNIDPTPFTHKPYELAALLDPKSLEALEALGGVTGLLRGLGTTEEQGLGRHTLERTTTMKSEKGTALGDNRPGAGGGASPRHDPEKDEKTVPAITLTDSGGKAQSPDGAAFSSTLEDRRRIYGANLLPSRASKTLLQLMWAAMKDKVLVSFFLIFVTLFEDLFGFSDPSVYRRCCFPGIGTFPGLWNPKTCR